MSDVIKIRFAWVSLMISGAVGIGGWVYTLGVSNQVQASQGQQLNDHENRIRAQEKTGEELAKINAKLDALRDKIEGMRSR